jgi:ankyrin repeat protein
MRPRSALLVAPIVCALALLGCRSSPESLRSSLMKAVMEDDTEEVKRLIEKGADANGRETPGGWSALHYAARIGNVEVVELLLSRGADPNYAGTTPGQKGSTLISVIPIALAQASQALTRMIPASQVDQTLSFQDAGGPALIKSLKDPKADERYQRVIDILSKVTKHP